MVRLNAKNRYVAIIEAIFLDKHKKGTTQVDFERQDIERYAQTLGIRLPSNVGDLVYSFRYRAELPDSVKATAPKGKAWIIRPAGRGRYRFVLVTDRPLVPNLALATTKVPDATPGVIAKYALSDEQALLAKLRYNRLVDIFTGVTCYSLQNHLRTTVPQLGQVETDELYVGVDKRGAHYVLPIQAKGGRDRLSVVQIEQDIALCLSKFPALVCRPIGAQFMAGNVIALFEFVETEDGVQVAVEKHYRLVPPNQVTVKDLELYRVQTE